MLSCRQSLAQFLIPKWHLTVYERRMARCSYAAGSMPAVPFRFHTAPHSLTRLLMVNAASCAFTQDPSAIAALRSTPIHADLNFNDVAVLHPQRRRPLTPDAAGSAGDDHVAGLESRDVEQ